MALPSFSLAGVGKEGASAHDAIAIQTRECIYAAKLGCCDVRVTVNSYSVAYGATSAISVVPSH